MQSLRYGVGRAARAQIRSRRDCSERPHDDRHGVNHLRAIRPEQLTLELSGIQRREGDTRGRACGNGGGFTSAGTVGASSRSLMSSTKMRPPVTATATASMSSGCERIAAGDTAGGTVRSAATAMSREQPVARSATRESVAIMAGAPKGSGSAQHLRWAETPTHDERSSFLPARGDTPGFAA